MSLRDDVREPLLARFEKFAVREGHIALEDAKEIVVEVWGKIGIDVELGTRVVKGVAQRTLDILVDRGVLKRATTIYLPVQWRTVLGNPDFELSQWRQVRHRDSRKLVAKREDRRGRELVDLNGKTFDVAKLKPVPERMQIAW